MKNSTVLILLLATHFLSGCADQLLLVGQPGPAVDIEDVTIYYIERPNCNFETIAHIRADGGYYSLESMLRNMREEAARVGANGLFVLQTQQLDIREFLGAASAIRCLPV